MPKESEKIQEPNQKTVDKEQSRIFWNEVANNTTLPDASMAGMLTDGDPYISRLRQEGEEKHFVTAFDLRPDMHVLEVGTGGGRWAFFLADKVASVVGIDFSANMIDRANEALAARGTANASFEVGELTTYETQRKFDLIYLSSMLQYLSDAEVVDTLKRAKELLTDHGLIVSRDSVQGIKRVVLEGHHSVIYRTVSEYQTLFSQADFTLTYNEVSYPDTRFSTFASKLYKLPFFTYQLSRLAQRILLAINNLLGNPRWLMKAHHKQALNSDGVRDHRFFRYEQCPSAADS